MSTEVAKPRLRNLGMRQWGMALAFSLFASGAFAVWFKINVVERRKNHFKEFYENYDDNAAFQSMKEAGVFKGYEA